MNGEVLLPIAFASTHSSVQSVSPRLYVLRRISGHLRRDGQLWTFIFFNDPYVDLSAAHYALDIPGGVQHPLSSWITEYVNKSTPEALLRDLSVDGFGLVTRVLREIKSTWKLLLNEIEHFLELLVSHGLPFVSCLTNVIVDRRFNGRPVDGRCSVAASAVSPEHRLLPASTSISQPLRRLPHECGYPKGVLHRADFLQEGFAARV